MLLASHHALQVPSAYFLTDVFLFLDKLLGGNLLRTKPKTRETKMSLGGMEGLKMKRLVGSLRALWRSSQKYGSDDRITELKGYLRPSPSPHRADEDEDDDAGGVLAPVDPVSTSDGGSGSDDENDEDAIVPASGDADDGESDYEHQEVESIAPDHEEPNAGGLVPLSQQESDIDGESMSPAEAAPAQDAGHVGTEHDSDSSEDSLDAPTLQLGEHDSDSSDENQRDSQVSSGWLGKAYNLYNRIDREEKDRVNKIKHQQELHDMVEDIRWDIEGALGTTVKGTQVWEAYSKRCYHALDHYGVNAYGMLATVETSSLGGMRRTTFTECYLPYTNLKRYT